MKYIKLKNKKYEIRNDLESMLIFYDNFLFRPIFPIYAKSFLCTLDKILRIVIILFVEMRLNKLIFRTKLKHDFTLRRFGEGKNATIITLKKVSDNNFKLCKYYKSKELLKHDLDFYSKYNRKNKYINLPIFKISGDKVAEISFIKKQNLAAKIKLGFFNENQLEQIFNELNENLERLYGGNPLDKVLVHGDLSSDNVYYDNGIFSVIDYGDSHIYYKNYDKYIFLRRISIDYYGKINKKLIRKYFSDNEINKFEKHLSEFMSNKYDYQK